MFCPVLLLFNILLFIMKSFRGMMFFLNMGGIINIIKMYSKCYLVTYFVMYMISFMLILSVLIRYRPVLTNEFSYIRYSKVCYTDNEKVRKLNALWNMYPTDHSSLIFMHSFDGVTNTSNFGHWKGYCDDKSSWPWCPASSALLSNWYLNVLGMKLRFPPIELPIEGVSFSAFNKHIIPLEGEVIFNGDNASGLLFKYFNDKLISPMCYYASDGTTIIRSNGGCGHLGLQLQPISFSEHGYNMNTTQNDISGKKIYESWTKYAQSFNPLLMLFQDSLNINQFLKIAEIKSKSVTKSTYLNNLKHFVRVSDLNEVIFKSWRNIDFFRVPLFAFFHSKNASFKIKEEIHEIAKLFERNVKKRLPVVSFDPENSSEPFKLSTIC